jgi:hypothetical protein
MIIDNFIDASLLGDGCIKATKTNSYYRISQIAPHKDYIDFVTSILETTVKTRLYYYEKRADGKNASPWYILETRVHPLFVEKRKQWYPEGIKIVPRNIKLTPQMLAIWIMDDGTYNKPRAEIKMCTNAFTIEDAEFLKERMYVDLNLKASVRVEKKANKKQPLIYILRPSTRDVPQIVREFMLESFNYKIQVQELRNKKSVR